MFVYVYKYTRANGNGETSVAKANATWPKLWWDVNGNQAHGESNNIVKFEGFLYEINGDLTLSLHDHFSYEAAPVKPRTVINKK